MTHCVTLPRRAIAHCSLLLGLSSFSLLFPQYAFAQSITATPDGTGTLIQHNGNTYTITGGTQVGNNLFHSFQELGLSPREIADFLANPQTQNILGRVTGGNPSILNGLLQVTGSNANLYLINPAGIVFGREASLNIPASFFATTADAIGFDSGYFTATGQVDYSSLVGTPNQFVFASSQPGTIVNAADLTLNPGHTLGLIGGSIIHTGTIAAPDSNISLTAVPGSSNVRINQDGMILGLEVPQAALASGIAAVDLPQLLVGQDATGISSDATGTRLTNTNTIFETSGNTVIAGQLLGDTINLAAANQVLPLSSPQDLIRTHNGQFSAPTVTRFAQSASDSNAYIFLDATVPDYNDLLYGGKPGSTTVVVTPTEDGIAKITETLTTPGLTPVDELHLVSEGSSGNFWLGSAFVSSDNIAQYQTQLQQWQQGLSSGADILLYACLAAAGNVGEALLNDIARYTGADVAGSTNITGSAALGGDWLLERRVGNIEANLPFSAEILQNYANRLAIFTVTNGNDVVGQPGSLRQAISDANALAGDDEIRFAPGLTQVSLTLAQLDIDTATGGLTIDGNANGTSNVIVERSASAPAFRIFNITGTGNVTIDSLTIRNGETTGDGGGINREGTGTLTVTNSTITNNTGFSGGGIFSEGNVIVTNSTISNNQASLGDGNGGGIASDGDVTLTNSTVSGNSAFRGGGIYSEGNTTLTNSTISGNSANTDGGGAYTNGSVLLINSTISGNSANVDGGGFYSSGNSTILNSTITNNVADADADEDGNGGGFIHGGNFATVANSIIAGNFDRSTTIINPNVTGSNINGNANNLVGDTTGAITGAIGTGSDLTFASLGITNINQVLNPLANNGGPTQTHALVVGSPAIDAGNNANIPNGITTDQRGATRIFNNTVDIGAVESHYGLIASGTPQSTQINTAFNTPLGVQFGDVFFNLPVAFSGLSVTFTVPSSGASGVLGNGATVFTDANGFASNPFTANGIAGSYQVIATAAGFTSARFDLTNLTPASDPPPSTPTVPTGTLCPPQCEEKNEITDAEEEEILSDLVRFQNEETDSILDSIEVIEAEFTSQYTEYFGLEEVPAVSLAEAQDILQTIFNQTGEKPALLYVIFVPATATEHSEETTQKVISTRQSEPVELWQFSREGLVAQNESPGEGQGSDRLELLLVTADAKPVRVPVRGVTREQVFPVFAQFRRSVTNPVRATAYRQPAQQLYEWIVAPLEAELQAREITNIAFIMDAGLRSLPVAALYDGNNFLIERYSLGMMPSLSLTDTRYRDVRQFSVLAMGAENFATLQPLPAVPIELNLIAESLWPGNSFLNSDFTIDNLKATRQADTYGIIHLATHAEFNPGDPQQSYIQFWGDTQLNLTELRELSLYDLPVELLVLSACRTALGNREAELGFTGLAVQAGVKSALGSLWYVSDIGTLTLMSEFYAQLRANTTKAESLRQAQLAILRGDTSIVQNQLVGSWGSLPLSEELAEGNSDFTHPFYWSAFTLVGSPW